MRLSGSLVSSQSRNLFWHHSMWFTRPLYISFKSVVETGHFSRVLGLDKLDLQESVRNTHANFKKIAKCRKN